MRASRLARLHDRGMAVLLVLLVATVFVVPAIMPDDSPWRLVTDVLAALILLSGVVAVVDQRKVAIALAALSAVALAARGIEWIAPATLLPALREAFLLSALTLLAVAVGVNVFGQHHRLHERIIGAVVLYLLIGLTWAVVYTHVNALSPGASARAVAVTTDWPTGSISAS